MNALKIIAIVSCFFFYATTYGMDRDDDFIFLLAVENFLLAVERGDIESVQLMLDYERTAWRLAACRDYDGRTPLHRLARASHDSPYLALAHMLLGSGADPNACDKC